MIPRHAASLRAVADSSPSTCRHILIAIDFMHRIGALVGLAVGCIVEGVTDLMLTFSIRQNHVVAPVANGNLFDRKLPKMMSED